MDQNSNKLIAIFLINSRTFSNKDSKIHRKLNIAEKIYSLRYREKLQTISLIRPNVPGYLKFFEHLIKLMNV